VKTNGSFKTDLKETILKNAIAKAETEKVGGTFKKRAK
jgi:hypothetical protein